MTYEEISTKYPIGKLLYRRIAKVKRAGFWNSEQDKEIYLSKHPDAEFTWNGGVIYTESVVQEKYVQGWLYDGEKWSVAELSWDGWTEIDQEELDEYEKIGIAYEF
jgi:hypothetical protein